MSNKIYPSLACRLEFFAEDADGLPVTGLTHSDVSAAGYCRIQDGVLSSTTSLSLTSSAAYTAAVSSGQFVTINSARGHYAIDCPSGASAIAYDFAVASVTFTAGHTVTAIRHEIDATLYLTTANNATLGALSGRIPGSLVSGRMDCSVGAMANDVITAAAIASNALSIAKFAADIGTTAYASNPLAKAVWERLLSAMTTAGSAGKKLSDQANADVSALALQSTLNAVGVLATAIDAKTSQLAFTTPNKVDASAVLDSATLLKIDAILEDTGTTLPGQISSGGTESDLMVSTTIATLASQTSFTLTAGSADDDAYNRQLVVITDAATSTQKARVIVEDYVGSSKTVTLTSAPAFTIAAGDSISIIAIGSDVSSAYIASTIGSVIVSSGITTTVTGMPTFLRVGDARTVANGGAIPVRLYNVDDDSLLFGLGENLFEDATITFSLRRAGTDVTEGIEDAAIPCTWVEDGADGYVQIAYEADALDLCDAMDRLKEKDCHRWGIKFQWGTDDPITPIYGNISVLRKIVTTQS